MSGRESRRPATPSWPLDVAAGTTIGMVEANHISPEARAKPAWQVESDRLAKRMLRWAWLALALTCWLPIGVSLAVSPDAIEAGDVRLSPPCPYKARTGKACPSCGLTRAFCAIGHGQLARARRYHGASPYLYGMLIVGGFVALEAARGAFRQQAQPMASAAS